MKQGKQYSVLFNIKGMHGEFNNVVDVESGKTIEKAVQKKYQTTRQIVILSKVLLNEWSNG